MSIINTNIRKIIGGNFLPPIIYLQGLREYAVIVNIDVSVTGSNKICETV